MAIIQSGVTTDLLTVDPTTKAARVTAKPTEYGTLGHYKWGASTGILPAALGANSEIVQFRWSNSTNLCLITKIRVSAAVTTTFFAAGVPVEIDIIKSTAWTVAGTGGTAPTLAATLKTRSSMGNSLIAAGDLRIATTAALGAGTKTLEANSMASLVAAGPITASLNGTIIPPGTVMWEPDMGDGEHPLLLGTNEGFSIRSVAVPATGTWRFSVNINWVELSAF
jgi:hypothetical protein